MKNKISPKNRTLTRRIENKMRQNVRDMVVVVEKDRSVVEELMLAEANVILHF
jgi:hypothetical protein